MTPPGSAWRARHNKIQEPSLLRQRRRVQQPRLAHELLEHLGPLPEARDDLRQSRV